MTVKQLRTTTAPYNDIEIVYCSTALTLTAEDSTMLQAFGNYVIDTISIKDAETITAT